MTHILETSTHKMVQAKPHQKRGHLRSRYIFAKFQA